MKRLCYTSIQLVETNKEFMDSQRYQETKGVADKAPGCSMWHTYPLFQGNIEATESK